MEECQRLRIFFAEVLGRYSRFAQRGFELLRRPWGDEDVQVPFPLGGLPRSELRVLPHISPSPKAREFFHALLTKQMGGCPKCVFTRLGSFTWIGLFRIINNEIHFIVLYSSRCSTLPMNENIDKKKCTKCSAMILMDCGYKRCQRCRDRETAYKKRSKEQTSSETHTQCLGKRSREVEAQPPVKRVLLDQSLNLPDAPTTENNEDSEDDNFGKDLPKVFEGCNIY
jgi:hypothetical protein